MFPLIHGNLIDAHGYLVVTGIGVALVLILSVFDAISTKLGWKKGARELNKVEVLLQSVFPNTWQYYRVVLGFAFAAALWFMPQPISAVGMWMVIVGYGFAVMSNYGFAWKK